MKNAPAVRRLVAAAAVALLPSLGVAAEYTYIEGGFIQRDTFGRSDGGFRLGGSLDIGTLPLAAFGEYSSNDELDQFSAGAIFHAPLNRELDWFAGGSFEFVDLGFRDEAGFGFRGGLRWTPSRLLELTPEVRYFNVFEDGNTSVRLGAAYTIAPQFALTGAVQGGDDDRFEIGARYTF